MFRPATSWIATRPLFSRSLSARAATSTGMSIDSAKVKREEQPPLRLNLSTIQKEELQTVVVDSLGYPKYRADQIWHWIRNQGVTDTDQMNNLPKSLRHQLAKLTVGSVLVPLVNQVSNDGTIKRAYQCNDGQVIESVLMPYEDGRTTACISSQAGCAQGCVFCATGQMGFSRQLTADEIFEQVSRFAGELKQETNKSQRRRLSNIVFMGMGEPLANYRQVKKAVQRITNDLGIGARKITISTVGIVPNIYKLADDEDMPQVRLAISLHCASEEERSALLPANARYGGLDELMKATAYYMEKTGRRITFEWALIAGDNDTPETARKLGNLIRSAKLRRDLVHINVIPLNPTGGFGGSPSHKKRVDAFCHILTNDYGVACTPRVRRGIDIDAGCGQLKSDVLKKQQEAMAAVQKSPPVVGVYEEDDDSIDPLEVVEEEADVILDSIESSFIVSDEALDFEMDDFEDPTFSSETDLAEANRLIALVQGTVVPSAILNDEPVLPPTAQPRLQRTGNPRKQRKREVKA